jgi:hypothetical protein
LGFKFKTQISNIAKEIVLKRTTHAMGVNDVTPPIATVITVATKIFGRNFWQHIDVSALQFIYMGTTPAMGVNDVTYIYIYIWRHSEVTHTNISLI